MIEIDLCPFDRGQAKLEVVDETLGIVRVFCLKCGACGPYFSIAGHIETARHRAAKLWNERVPEPESVGLAKRLRDLISRSTDADDAVLKALKEAAVRIERQDLELRDLRGDAHG